MGPASESKRQCIPKKRTNSHEMIESLDEPRAHSDDTPDEGKTWQPDAGRDLLQDEITRDLAEDVRGVVDREANVVLVVGDANLVLEAVQSRVTHVRPVEEGAQE